MDKKIVIALSIVFLCFITILSIKLLSSEDSWTCDNGQWVAHGNPSAAMPTSGCGDNQQNLVGNDRDEHGCIGSAGYSWCEAKQKCLRSWEEDCAATSSTAVSSTIEYKNTDYGFSLQLPQSWTGYSIVTETWQGTPKATGRKISIRHPQWTKETPRQDIPVLIFTLDQWNQIQQEKLVIGAAPIAPSELGRNVNYVFALPARYNFAFPAGFEEVETIINSQPLSAF